MKMAFVTGIKFSEYQGAYYATTFSREVIQQRYLAVFGELTVVASADPGDAQTPASMVLSSGNGVHFHFQKSAPRTVDYFLKRTQLRRELADILGQMDGAIIRLPSFLGLMACEICEKLHKPHLVELVGCPWDALWNHSWKGRLLAPALFLKTRQYVQRASHVIYTSKYFLEKRYPTTGKFTHCSNVALNEFDPAVLERRRLKIKTPARTTVIGSCGKIDLPFKGHRFVVEAISILNQQGYDFHYELVGAGNPDYIMNIARRYGVQNQVRVLGTKQREDVFRWLETLDLYAQPSLTEGLPRALVEAMSRAVPSFGSAIGGIPEFLGPRGLFGSQSVRALIETLKYVEAHRLEMAEDAYARSKEYAAELVEARRIRMFQDFKEYVAASGNSQRRNEDA